MELTTAIYGYDRLNPQSTAATPSEQFPIRNICLRHFAITRLQLAASLTKKH
ncbi:hypothetical protein D3C84_374740 [compost metagenome]